MKKIILTLAIGMLASGAFSQSYHKLIRTNTNWDSYYTFLPEMCYTGAKRDFIINQDTLINGHTYKISKYQQILRVNPGPFCPPFVVDTVSYTGAFLREDTVARRVYINSEMTGGTDVLLYDFSLHAGDTLKSTYLGAGNILIIDMVENLLLNNGETRKSFYVKYSPGGYYTEGIGSSFGLYAQLPVYFCECNGGFFCVEDNSVNLLGSQCDYPYVGQQEIESPQVSVFPNPAHGMVNVFIPLDLAGSEFNLINVRGEQLFSHTLGYKSNGISISHMNPGLYFYQVKSGRLIQTGKLTIQ